MPQVTVRYSAVGKFPFLAYRYPLELWISASPTGSPYRLPFVLDVSSDYSIIPASMFRPGAFTVVQPATTSAKSSGTDTFVEMYFRFLDQDWDKPGQCRYAFPCPECRITTARLKRGHLAMRDFFRFFTFTVNPRHEFVLSLRPIHDGIPLGTAVP